MPLSEPLDLRPLGFAHPDAQRLVDEVQAVYVEIYGSPDETPVDPTEFDPPGGAFFVGYCDDRPVAIGGWRLRTDIAALGRTRAAEIKRMYVVADARRGGLARVVLAHLEDTARAAGADLMVLETGIKQLAAVTLYESAGYVPIEAYGFYRCAPESRYYGRAL